MGSWGVKAMQSDFGLDLLIIVEERYLQGVKFKTFHVKHITELLRAYIIDEFTKESYGWESEYIDFFYSYTFPYRYDEMIILIAECLTEYLSTGRFAINIFEKGSNNPRRKKITEFIFTDDDLNCLLTNLRNVLNPECGLYESWKDSKSFDEWQAHIKGLIASIEKQVKQAESEV